MILNAECIYFSQFLKNSKGYFKKIKPFTLKKNLTIISFQIL